MVPRSETWVYGPTVPARWTPYGTGCAGSAGTPGLAPAAGQVPWLGAAFPLQVTAMPTPGLALAWLGLSRLAWSGVPLPADLTAIGMPGCSLRASFDIPFAVLATGGVANWVLQFPLDTTLLGLEVFAQAGSLDAAANAFGLALANAGELRLGGK